MKLIYFAAVREAVGRDEEILTPPSHIRSLRDMIIWLRARGGGYGIAFAETQPLSAAIDEEHASLGAPIANAREIAFFPPVTGG